MNRVIVHCMIVLREVVSACFKHEKNNVGKYVRFWDD